MLKDLLRAEDVTVYRLQGIADYDFSSSEEGEVDEVWGIVAEEVRSRFRWGDDAFSRRPDGIVEVGTHVCYVDADIDIMSADRIYRPNGDTGPEFFSVRAVKTIRDRHWQVHHKEVRLDHIDWIRPEYDYQWIPPEDSYELSIQKAAFDYTTTTKSLASVVATDWLHSISIQIIVPFDDPDASISVGDGGLPSNLVDYDSIDLTINGGYYEEVVSKEYSANDEIFAYLDAAASTQGSGVIFANIARK